MKISNRVGRKLISLFTTLAISAGALVGLSTAANAAAAVAFPGDSVGPNISTAVTKNPTGNQSATFWFRWENVTATGYTPVTTDSFTVDTCSGNNLGSGVHQVSVYFSASPLGSAPTSGALTPTRTTDCGSSGKGKQVVVSVSAAGYFYVKIVIPQNGTYDFTASFKSGAAGSAPTASYVELDRVTICHRTHATTNPYRIITVSTSSIVGSAADGSPIRGHAKHATDARRYDPDLYGTYDSTKTYRPNAKLWGDIIPPFKDKSTGGIFQGLNWKWSDPTDSDANAILDKTEFDNVTVSANSSSTVAQSAVDLCKGASGNLTSKQLFDLERKNGEKRKDILDEMADTDQYEPEVYKEKGNLDKELPAKEGPKNPTTNPIAQSLDGTVWLDINRNGFQESNEPYMANIKVTVAQGTSPAAASGTFSGFGTGAKYFADNFGTNWFTTNLDSAINRLTPVVNSIRSIFGMATTYTVYTDKNGYFIFKSLAAGDWYVAGVVPAGLDVTYDSAGVSDATVDTTVPAGGHASTWIGLMGDSTTGIKSLVLNPDGTPATQDVVITASGTDGIFCNADDVSFIIAPVNGVIEMSGLINSSYYVRQIGTTATIADFNIASGTIYTNDIKTVKGTRCALLTGQQLAATGGNVDGISLAALIMLMLGTVATVIGVRKTRVLND